MGYRKFVYKTSAENTLLKIVGTSMCAEKNLRIDFEKGRGSFLYPPKTRLGYLRLMRFMGKIGFTGTAAAEINRPDAAGEHCAAKSADRHKPTVLPDLK